MSTRRGQSHEEELRDLSKANTLKSPKNYPTDISNMPLLTDVQPHTHVHALVFKIHVDTQTSLEQIFIKLLQGPVEIEFSLSLGSLQSRED